MVKSNYIHVYIMDNHNVNEKNNYIDEVHINFFSLLWLLVHNTSILFKCDWLGDKVAGWRKLT